jgi:ectoine hydroxylase-related dioxygenase (phytanoyl-CoA dioxygenase family)
MEVAEQIALLEEQGYLIIENAIAPEMCDEIVSEITRLEETGARSLSPNSRTGFNTVRFFDLLNQGEVWQRVATHPSLVPVLKGVLGDDMLLSTMGTAVIGPGEPAQVIHRDDGLYGIAMPHRNLVCNTLWALTDFTQENGATQLVPDTHRLLEEPDPKAKYDAISAIMPKGSVLLILGTTYHGGGSNQSSQRRYALTINYCYSGMRQQENLMLAVSRDKAARFPRGLQELVGYRISNTLVGHIGGTDPRSVLPVEVRETVDA